MEHDNDTGALQDIEAAGYVRKHETDSVSEYLKHTLIIPGKRV
jgi:hypothetical protein